jgi:cobalt-zinc-cadmium efflux system outer membrane protein
MSRRPALHLVLLATPFLIGTALAGPKKHGQNAASAPAGGAPAKGAGDAGLDADAIDASAIPASAPVPESLLSMPRTGPPTSNPAKTLVVTCDEVPDLVLQRNYQVILAQLNVEGAKADLVQAKLYVNPNVSLSVANFPIGHRSQPANVTATSVTDFTSADYLSGVPLISNITLSQTILLWNKRGYGIDVANYGIDVFGARLDDLVRSLRGQAATQCYATLELSLQVDTLRDNIKNFNQVRELNAKRLQAGAIDQVDYQKIELQYQGEALVLQQTQFQLAQAMLQLKYLLALPADTDLRIDDNLDPANFVDENQDYLALAMANRPDIKAAQLAVQQDNSSYLLALAQGKPDITLGIGYTYDHNLGDFPNTLNFGIGVDLPLFNRNQGAVQHAAINVQQDQTVLAQTQNQVSLDVKNALAQYEIAKQALLIYRSGLTGTTRGVVAQAQYIRKIATAQWQAGATTLMDLISAERDYNLQTISYLQAEAALIEAIAQLQEAVGSKTAIPMVAAPPSSDSGPGSPTGPAGPTGPPSP